MRGVILSFLGGLVFLGPDGEGDGLDDEDGLDIGGIEEDGGEGDEDGDVTRNKVLGIFKKLLGGGNLRCDFRGAGERSVVVVVFFGRPRGVEG